MATTPPPQRFLLLPPRGMQASAAPTNAHLSAFMHAMRPLLAPAAGLARAAFRVIDAVHEDGLKLVEMTPAGLLQLRTQAPGVRVIPEVFYELALAPRPNVLAQARTQAGAKPAVAVLTLVLEPGGAPVRGATVTAFTDFAKGIGDEGVTRADGTVRLKIGPGARIARLYIYPRDSCWPLLRKNLQLPLAAPIRLRQIDLAQQDALQHFRALVPGKSGQGVTVGIVDTGCGPHPDLPIAGGVNTVVGEDPRRYEDNGDQHGTHVAGIVGARGQAPLGMAGVAPGAVLRAYRVFAKGKGASNYAIAKALDRAVADGCDIINMSLAGGPADPATSAAIADARAAGAAVICASGNDGEHAVSQPAADTRSVAVGCFGRKGTFPANSVSASNVGRPLGKPDAHNFMANFSNHGPEIDLAGPGVGIVSTVPGSAWAVMDGTSMASPAVAGAVACLLSAKPSILNMARGQARSDAILQLAFQAARSLGFGPEYEGSGWIMK
jgi:subtilisin family serine protease